MTEIRCITSHGGQECPSIPQGYVLNSNQCHANNDDVWLKFISVTKLNQTICYQTHSVSEILVPKWTVYSTYILLTAVHTEIIAHSWHHKVCCPAIFCLDSGRSQTLHCGFQFHIHWGSYGPLARYVKWCMPGSLTSGFLWSWRVGKMFSTFPAHAQPAILRIW